MSISITLPQEYAYVIGVGILSEFVMTWLGVKVAKARDKFKVALPSLYADQAEANKDKDKLLFNCYQRAHQNALETYSQNLMMLFVGGLKHPIIASVGGLLWLAGRILYARGYYTGDPEKRMRGSLQYAGVFTLLGCTISTALTIAKLI